MRFRRSAQRSKSISISKPSLLLILLIVTYVLGSIILFTGNTQQDDHSTHQHTEHTRLIIEKWRDVDKIKSHPINSNPNLKGKLLPLSKDWGFKYKTRVLCLIPTLWPNRKDRMDLIAKYWGKGCTKLMWVIDKNSNPPESYAGHDVLILSLMRQQNNSVETGRNIWEKIHRLWSTIYLTPSLLNNYEWFVKADDDTFIATENLFGFLQYYNATYPHYIGHTIRSRWKRENTVFNSGTCYVLSVGTIKKIGPYLSVLPSYVQIFGDSLCIDRIGAGEDPTTGTCLSGVGIRPDNTLDHKLRERFLPFRDTDHIKMYREDTWYWKYKPLEIGEGMNSFSPYVISMHNYKNANENQKLFPILMEKYNQKKNWDKIELPPRPRWFLYDETQIDFKIVDEWLNTVNPPKGQRIYKGINNEWICNECHIGNPNDVFWTEWWDGKQLVPSQHVNDRYSPLSTK